MLHAADNVYHTDGNHLERNVTYTVVRSKQFPFLCLFVFSPFFK